MIIPHPVTTHELPSPNSNNGVVTSDGTTSKKNPLMMTIPQCPPEELVIRQYPQDEYFLPTIPMKPSIINTDDNDEVRGKGQQQEQEQQQQSSFVRRAPRVSFSTVQVRTHAVEYDLSDCENNDEGRSGSSRRRRRRCAMQRSKSCPRLGRVRTLGWNVVCEDQTYSIDSYKSTLHRRNTDMVDNSHTNSSLPQPSKLSKRSNTVGSLAVIASTSDASSSFSSLSSSSSSLLSSSTKGIPFIEPLDKAFDRWASDSPKQNAVSTSNDSMALIPKRR